MGRAPVPVVRFADLLGVDYDKSTELQNSYPLKPEVLAWASRGQGPDPMKKLFAIVLISVLTTAVRADDLATSFKQAVALAHEQDKEDAAYAYGHRDLNQYYQKKYSPVFLSCLKATDHPDTSPFSFVAAIGKDGRVLRLYIDHETNIFACVRQTLQQDEFPHPPLSPYYMHVSMSFGK